MDKNPIVSKIDRALPGAVLEVRRFGRSGMQSIWIESQSIQKVAAFLKNSEEYKIDWLENLSVVEFENVLVVTYFVRSSVQRKDSFVLRVSAVPGSPTALVEFPSIIETWPMGEPMEQEASEMFGILFTNKDVKTSAVMRRLPEGWEGFPLRKKYEFPKSFLGIPHSKLTNHMSIKKQEP